MAKKIVIVGAGGHAKVTINVIQSLGQHYEIVGIIGLEHEIGAKVNGVTVIGNDDKLFELLKNDINYACIGLGSVGDNTKRKGLYEKANEIGYKFPSLIHKKAIAYGKVEEFNGVQIMAGAIVQIDSVIGENTIINTGSIIEHDSVIGNHVHVSPGAIVCGGCVINDGTFIGAGAVVKQGVKIGENSTIAAGAVVIKDVKAGLTVKGVPAKAD